MAWTNELRETAARLWLEGKSAAFIAGQLGPSITRNAVIGLMHRSGISAQRIKPYTRSGESNAQFNYARPIRPLVRRPKRPIRPQRPRRLLPPDSSPIETKPVSLLDVQAGECRWPLNDSSNLDDFRFCGGTVWPRYSYCAGHLLRAYRTDDRARGTKRAEPQPALQCEPVG